MIGPIIVINNNRIKWSINLKIVPKTSALMVWQNNCIVDNGILEQVVFSDGCKEKTSQ